MNKTIATLLSIIFLSSFVSASYHIETTGSDSTHNYDDSSYIHPDYLPKQDIFYTPFNAYRTYYDAIHYPIETTQVIHIKEAEPIYIKKPNIILIHHPYPYHRVIVHKPPIHPRPMHPIFLR